MSQQIGYSGYTLEQLSAYFDSGRVPRIAAIEEDAEARAVLESMERISRMTREPASEGQSTSEPAWVERVLDVVRSEVRAGRDLPMHSIDGNTDTTVTEGALRELVRITGDNLDDVLVGSVSVRLAEGGLHARVTIGVRYGVPVRERAEAAREAVTRALLPHTPAPLRTLDVVVADVFATGEDVNG